MNNAKATVNILSSKFHINNKHNVHNIPNSSLQKSLPIIRTISMNNNNNNSKSIPKDIYHKNKMLKLSTDETPTLDMESSRNSSFITKPLPQTVQITKQRILSVIWANSKTLETNNIVINNNNIPLNTLVNHTSSVKQQNEVDDMSNFLNYDLGDSHNDSESIALSSIKHVNNNKEQVQPQDKCCINNNNNNCHLITSVRNYKTNLHMYKNSSLKEIEFDLSNVSSQLFTFDDLNTSYSRSVYNNDISEMKPNENINNVYKMNTCFTYTNNRNNNNNTHMQYKSKGAADNDDKQQKKIINGFYSDYVNSNSNNVNNKNAKSCTKVSFNKDKGRKDINMQCNNKNKHVDYTKGNVNKHKTLNNNKCLNRNVNKRYDNNNNVMNNNNKNNHRTLVTKKRNTAACLKDNTINKKPKTYEKM